MSSDASGGRVASPVSKHRVTTAYRIKEPRWSLGHHTGAHYVARDGTPCVAVLGGSMVRNGHDLSFGNFLVLRAGGVTVGGIPPATMRAGGMR
jgi:hypothetical protein